jgi:hypothetical protein
MANHTGRLKQPQRTLEEAEDEVLTLREELKLAQAALKKAQEAGPTPVAAEGTVIAYTLTRKGNNLWTLQRGHVPSNFAQEETEADTLTATLNRFGTALRGSLENPFTEQRMFRRVK